MKSRVLVLGFDPVKQVFEALSVCRIGTQLVLAGLQRKADSQEWEHTGGCIAPVEQGPTVIEAIEEVCL